MSTCEEYVLNELASVKEELHLANKKIEELSLENEVLQFCREFLKGNIDIMFDQDFRTGKRTCMIRIKSKYKTIENKKMLGWALLFYGKETR